MERMSAGTSATGEILLVEAPPELTETRLKRLGEGIGKVVYCSDHWVVKRERSPYEILGLVVVWRTIRKCQRFLPAFLCRNLLDRPSKRIRLLRMLAHASMAVVPKTLWYSNHIQQVWKEYYVRSRRGDRLAQTYLEGTSLIPDRIEFPPVRVRIPGWPGWLMVSEATERVECTLLQKLDRLASRQAYGEIEDWLNRLLDLRQSGWRHGLFSADAHLKNFGVIGWRVVLLDTGGLTNRLGEIERCLENEERIEQPHIRLGLGPLLAPRPDIARRFNERWRAVVNRENLRELWPQTAA